MVLNTIFNSFIRCDYTNSLRKYIGGYKVNYTKDTMPDGTIYENYEGTPIEIGELISIIRKNMSKYDMCTNRDKERIARPVETILREGEYLWECVVCEEIVEEGQYYCHNCGQHLLQAEENI